MQQFVKLSTTVDKSFFNYFFKRKVKFTLSNYYKSLMLNKQLKTGAKYQNRTGVIFYFFKNKEYLANIKN